MATSFKTPGVYVQEISTLPASVAQVETAVPAFVGYTEKAEKDGEDLTNKPLRITSFSDFELYFGGGPQAAPTVLLDENNNYSTLSVTISTDYYLYGSMQLYFANGGGPCYIVSVGDYTATVAKADLDGGIDQLEQEDEPTIIAVPDASLLSSASDRGAVQSRILTQANKLQDRFGVFDVYESGTFSTDLTNFRTNIGTQNLKYGAAYAPFLNSSLQHNVKYENISFRNSADTADVSLATVSADTTVAVALDAAVADVNKIKKLLEARYATSGTGANMTFTYTHTGSPAGQTLEHFYNVLTGTTKTEIIRWAVVIKGLAVQVINLYTGGNSDPLTNTTNLTNLLSATNATSELQNIISALASFDYGYDAINGTTSALAVLTAGTHFNGTHPLANAAFNYALTTTADSSIYLPGTTSAEYHANSEAHFLNLFDRAIKIVHELIADAESVVASLEKDLETTNPIYTEAINTIRKERITLPPSGAIAGIYAAVDRDRGVWKAPANVSISTIIGPTERLTNDDQDGMNVDVDGGKSINAIRSFTGRGTMVWGARTLAGNDNEWRYVPVRRLFNTVEESVKKATGFVVFEPNDANTWLRVKSMIENYLLGLWRQGALAGATPEQAFFVSVGLGETMIEQDILEGNLIVEIGMAAVRPAEFIILKFSHKIQEG